MLLQLHSSKGYKQHADTTNNVTKYVIKSI